MKLIRDCVIARSQEQNDVRVTGEATSGRQEGLAEKLTWRLDLKHEGVGGSARFWTQLQFSLPVPLLSLHDELGACHLFLTTGRFRGGKLKVLTEEQQHLSPVPLPHTLLHWLLHS